MVGRAVGSALVGLLVLVASPDPVAAAASAGPAGATGSADPVVVAASAGPAAVAASAGPAGVAASPDPVAVPPPDGGDVRSSFGWPLVPAPAVVRPFQAPSQPYGPGHRGADLAGAVGQPVLAAADGVVLYAGLLAGRGVISIRHTAALRTTYEPVTAVVGVGQLVRRGEVIGHLEPGHPGCPEAACLHWGLRSGDEYLDPVPLLRAGRVRLLPWLDDG